jgi:parallel beta-helix repeat protein
MKIPATFLRTRKTLSLRAAPMYQLIQHRIQPACNHPLSQLLVWLRIGLITSTAVSWGSSGAIAQIILPSQVPFRLAQSTENATVYPVLYVNPVTGNDSTGDGSDRAPFKTITQALQVAQPNSMIQLAPGTYSVETGEVFPIALRPRMTIQGNPDNRGQDVVIRGGGWFSGPSSARRSITILGGANYSTLSGVTITNPTGFGIQVEFSNPTLTNNTFQGSKEGGIVVTGNSAPVIRNNFFYQNDGVGIRVQNTARPSVQDNIFEETGTAILVCDRAIPEIIGNRITRNKMAIVLQGQARPTLGNNSIENNEQNELISPASTVMPSSTTATSTIPFGTQLPGATATPTAPVAKAETPIHLPSVSRSEPPTAAPAQPSRSADTPVPAKTTIVPANSITAASFPVPGNAGHPTVSNSVPRSMQVVRLNSFSQPAAAEAPIPSSSGEIPEATVVVKQAKSRSPVPAPLPTAATASTLPTQAVTSRRSIRIPVPATATGSESTFPTESPLASPSEQAAAIPIPVPPPESGTVTPTPARMLIPTPSTPTTPRPPAQAVSILPVPSPDIPLGNISGMPKVYTTGSAASVSTKSLAAAPATSTGAIVRYRVVVAATDGTQQAQVRSIVPEAFPISYKGKSMMQAGAFSDRSRADQLASTLISQGLAASVEEMK